MHFSIVLPSVGWAQELHQEGVFMPRRTFEGAAMHVPRPLTGALQGCAVAALALLGGGWD